VLGREVATLEYFARGAPALAVLGPAARCPIVGPVRPRAAPAEARVR
jgi:hypothetical protein